MGKISRLILRTLGKAGMGLKRIFSNSKKMAQLGCGLLFLFPVMACAIGLGDIKLHSALNETMNADIAILQMGSMTFGQLQVGLAGADEYKQFDVERNAAAESLTFKLTYNAQKKPIIHVGSDKPVDTPILTFIVRLNARNGKILRQYTLFLDPPQYAHLQVIKPTTPEKTHQPSLAEPLTANEKEYVNVSEQIIPEKEKIVIKEKPIITVKHKEPEPVVKHTTKMQEYGPTTNQDTLWGIANQFELNGTSPQQFMVAIFRKNPGAFTYNNMNGLKTNVVLQIPTVAEANAISKPAAMQEMQAQKAAWDNLLAGESISVPTPTKQPPSPINQPKPPAVKPVIITETKPSITPTPGSAPTPASIAPTSPMPVPTITLQPEQSSQPIPLEKPAVIAAPPINQTPTQPNDNILLPKGGNDELVKTLQNELTISNNALNESKQSNEALQQKMDDMILQYKQILNLLSQKDLRINELEKNLAAIGQTKPVPKGPVMTQKSDEGQSLSTTVLRIGSQGGTLPTPKKGMSVMLGVSIFIVIMLLGAGLFWMYRRRQFATEEKIFFSDTSNNQHEVPDVLMDENLMTQKSTDTQVNEKAESSKEMEIQEEASVYMAYGRYQRAAQVLEAAIAEKLGNVDMLVMLLECYVNLKDTTAYEACFSKLPANLATTHPELERKVGILQQQMFSQMKQEEPAQENISQSSTEMSNPTSENIKTTSEEPLAAEPVATVSAPVTEVEKENTPTDAEPIHEMAYEPVEIKTEIAQKQPEESDAMDEEHTIAFDSDPDVTLEQADDTHSENQSAATKLDLARVYIDMGEVAEARALLIDVQQTGDQAQQAESAELLKKLDTH